MLSLHRNPINCCNFTLHESSGVGCISCWTGTGLVIVVLDCSSDNFADATLISSVQTDVNLL
jgi:hypothetical protein